MGRYVHYFYGDFNSSYVSHYQRVPLVAVKSLQNANMLAIFELRGFSQQLYPFSSGAYKISPSIFLQLWSPHMARAVSCPLSEKTEVMTLIMKHSWYLAVRIRQKWDDFWLQMPRFTKKIWTLHVCQEFYAEFCWLLGGSSQLVSRLYP